MKAKRNFLRHGNSRLCAPLRNFFSTLTGAGRLPAVALLLLLGSGGTAIAQQGNDCYTVLCPANQTKFGCTDQTPLGPYPIVIITNPCPNPGPLSIVCNPGPNTLVGPGMYPVHCMAVAGGAVIAQCDFTVTMILDSSPPQIECPGNIVDVACPSPTGGCGRNIAYPPPPASDNSGVVTVTCTPPSGSFFPCTITTVTCTAEDGCQNKASCQFTIRINPSNLPPSIQCPTDIMVDTCSNCAPVSFPLPVVNNGVLTGCNPAPGNCLPIGLTTVTCMATNACGSSQCSFDVRVLDGQGNPPTILCPADIAVTTCSNCAVVNYPAPGVNTGVPSACTPPAGTCFPIGATTVTCTASNDCGGSAQCVFKVVVRTAPPVIQCPTSPIVAIAPCTSNCVPVFYMPPVVTGGVLIGCTPPSGTCLPVGTHPVSCRATNDCGQAADCEFTLKILAGGGQPPLIQCPQDMTAETCTNCHVVNFPAPVVSLGVLAGCTPPAGACLPIGSTIVTCHATNTCGDASFCEFLVTVRLKPPVSVVCPNDLTVETCGNCQVVNYPAPSVPNGMLTGCTPPAGTCFPIGLTSVTCRATNDCGNSATCKFFITVRAVSPVGILCPGDIAVTTCGQGEIVQYPPPTLTGTTDPASVIVTCNPLSGSFFPLGATLVTCCVVDRCDRTNCCEFTVTVLPGNPCVKPPLNMVLWLPFDEPAGPIAHNIVAGALNGTHVNGPVPLPGQHVLNSLCFDGVNDHVRVPNYAAITLGLSPFSIDTWALSRDTAGGRRVIVSKMSQVAGGIAGYEFYLNNGVMNLLLRTPAGAFNFNSAVAVPLDSNWHFLAVTVQRGAPNVAGFYLDGNLVAIVNGALPGSVANASALHVGSRTFPVPGDSFLGCLDELEIFRRILTPLEIQKLWQAGRAGKCKIKCAVPWDVPFPIGTNYVTVRARIWNCSGVPQPIIWNAAGPMPIPVPNGFFTLPPFTCTNVMLQIGRPPNNFPMGRAVLWTLALSAGTQCPQVCTGSVINSGPAIVIVPTDPTAIPGTNRTQNVRISLNGLPPGQPIRLRAIGPDMEPDQIAINLNGLPPGVPWEVPPGLIGSFDVPVKFVDADPIGLYTILLEADLDGDGAFDTVASFDVENPVVPPPTLAIQKSSANVSLGWQDEGDGLGTLESTDDVVNGPWAPVLGGTPGMSFPPLGPQRFYRVSMPMD